VPSPDLMRDLARLQAVIVDLDDTRYRLRTDCHGHAAQAFQAAASRSRPRSPRSDPRPTPRRRPRNPPPPAPCSDKTYAAASII
jgi:hypothetical protein